jgi:hypothetical protein
MAHGVRYLAALAALAAIHCGPPGAGPEPPRAVPAGVGAAAGPAGEAPPVPAPWRSCLLDGASPCISAAPVHLDRELIAWSDWIADHAATRGHAHALGVTECRWVAELPQVLLCGSRDRGAMNPPLTRAAIFVEVRAHTLIRRAEGMYRRYAEAIGGFDLLKDHPDPARPDLLHYYAALDRACTADAAMCPDEPERAMRALLERAWAGKPRFVLVTFAHEGGIPDDEVVSHEILHAQYFTSPPYREAIDGYWRDLADAQRAAIRASLAGIYNAADEELMQNEFQAYVLMSGGERARLRRFVAAHRAPLLERLAARDQRPLEVQRRGVP